MSTVGPSSFPDSQGQKSAAEAPIVIPARRMTDRVGTVVMGLLGIGIVAELIHNPNFQWSVVAGYLFEPVVLRGVGLTLWLTAASMIIGLVLGVVLAVMRMSDRRWLSTPAMLYLWLFRGTPLLVQLIFWYNLAFLFPELKIAVPFGGPVFYDGSVNDLITPYSAALLGLALNEGAYMAEIVRSGILSVDDGQQEAGRALGMTGRKILMRVVLPQALRVIIPPTGNQTIGMLKTTSLVSVIALYDLLYAVQTIASRTFQTIPLLIVGSIWYLVLTSVLTVIQSRIETHFAAKTVRTPE